MVKRVRQLHNSHQHWGVRARLPHRLRRGTQDRQATYSPDLWLLLLRVQRHSGGGALRIESAVAGLGSPRDESIRGVYLWAGVWHGAEQQRNRNGENALAIRHMRRGCRRADESRDLGPWKRASAGCATAFGQARHFRCRCMRHHRSAAVAGGGGGYCFILKLPPQAPSYLA